MPDWFYDAWAVIGPLLGWGVRHYASEKQWSKVRQAARTVAKTVPAKTPLEAVEQALLKESIGRLSREAHKVRDAFVPKGEVPRLDIEVERTEKSP